MTAALHGSAIDADALLGDTTLAGAVWWAR